MKILFVTMQLGPGYTQGTERYVDTLTACLRSRGHEVKCLAGDPMGRQPRRALGQPFIHSDPCRQQDGTAPILSHPASGWMSIAGTSAKSAARWLESERPDVVHVANPAHIGVGVMDACRRLGIPVVVTTMDFWWLCPKATLLRPDGSTCDGTPPWRECVRCMAADHPRARLRWLGRLPEAAAPLTLGLYLARGAVRGLPAADMMAWPGRRQALRERLNAADAVIFPSAATRDLIRPHLGHGRWHVIPYGLTEEWFHEAVRRPPRGAAATSADPPRGAGDTIAHRPPRGAAATGGPVPPEALTIGYAGAMLPHKGPHLLLEAVRRLGWSRTSVRLAGPLDGGAYERTLREKAGGLTVEFAGWLNPEQMQGFFRSIDLLAMPSTWPENLPFVVLEAWAAGVPVVASRVAGVADQVGDQNLLFEPGSAEGLAAALSYAREHPGSRGLGRVHTAEAMTEATQEVYRAAIARRR